MTWPHCPREKSPECPLGSWLVWATELVWMQWGEESLGNAADSKCFDPNL